MIENYCDIMEYVNSQINFLKEERDYAFNKMKEIDDLNTLPIDFKKEIVEEWSKILEKLETQLNYFWDLKREINSSFQK